MQRGSSLTGCVVFVAGMFWVATATNSKMAQSYKRLAKMVTRAATVLGQVPDFVTIQHLPWNFVTEVVFFLSKLYSIDFLFELDKDKSILIKTKDFSEGLGKSVISFKSLSIYFNFISLPLEKVD